MAKKGCPSTGCPIHGQLEVSFAGNARANVVLVGESPGWEELAAQKRGEGEPFVGDSGKLARRNVKLAGLNWGAMFRMNSARCQILKDELTGKQITEILTSCRPNVTKLLQHIKPKCIILAGNFALRQVLRRSGITKAEGQWLWSKEFECWCMPMFHPAHILRNPALEPRLLEALVQVKQFIRNDFKPLIDEEGVNYKEIDSIQPLLDKAGEMELVLGIDTEGQGIDWVCPDYVMISYSISFKKGVARQIRLYEEGDRLDSNSFAIDWERLNGKKKEVVSVIVKRVPDFYRRLDELQALMEDERIKKYLMNGGFDLHVLNRVFERERGFRLRSENYTMDVQAAAHLIEENLFKYASLSQIQRAFTDYKPDYNGAFEREYDKSDMLAVPNEALVPYACADADVTRRAGVRLKQELTKLDNKKLARYFVRFVMPTLQYSLFELEENGAYVDMKALPEVSEDVEEKMNAAHDKALACLTKQTVEKHEKKGLRLTRDVLVADALFDTDGFALAGVRKTKSKAWSVDKEVRKTLLGRRSIGKKARTFLKSYNEWSEFHTLLSRYLKGFEKWVKPDGRIHASHSLVTAVTGRTAVSKPNMQNNPKRSDQAALIRRLIAAAPGKRLFAFDQGQSELRWAAHLSRDPEMMRIFKDRKRDIHTETARKLSKRPLEELDEHELWVARRNAKCVNFGLLFLMSLWGFIRYARNEYDLILNERQAQEFIDIFFGSYAGLRGYHRSTIEFCRKNGFVESPLGRRRRLPEINSKDKFRRMEAERMAVNHPVQNPSSDVCLMSLNEVLREEKVHPEEAKPVLFVHDELVFEMDEDCDAEKHARVIKHEMENPPLVRDFGLKLLVPLAVDVTSGPNLAEMKPHSL